MTRNHILVDIDHSISNAFWRDSMIGQSSWDEYHAASIEDAPIIDLLHLTDKLRLMELYNLVGITARPEKWRGLTMSWLVKHSVALDELLMRPDESFRPAPEIKLALARERFGGDEGIRNNVAFIIDDREDVMTAFRAVGITCLQVFARRD